MKIKDFSEKSLQKIFTKHISKEAKITTDKWKSYNPIAKDYNIKQIPSNSGLNFKALHTMIHQVKSWIRTAYSWVSKKNINRSQSKETIFNNLIQRMVNTPHICL